MRCFPKEKTVVNRAREFCFHTSVPALLPVPSSCADLSVSVTTKTAPEAFLRFWLPMF